MRRALFLSPKVPWPPDDGGRIVAWNLARALRHNGYAPDLVCFSGSRDDAPADALSAVFEESAVIRKNVERQNPTDLLAAFLGGGSYFVRKFDHPSLRRALEARLAVRRYSLTIIDSPYMGVYLDLLQSHADAAGHLLLRLNNVESELLERLAANQSDTLRRTLLRREARRFGDFENDLVRRVGDRRAISERDAAILGERSGVEVGVLPPFLDVDSLPPGDADEIEPGTALSIGDLTWPPNRRGAEWFAAEVWPRVREERPQARWKLVGRGAPASLRRLDGTDGIELRGYVEDALPCFRSAHAVLVPLLDGSGVRIKILTALALGRPVVSTTLGAEGIDGPGVVRADPPERFARETIRILDAPPTVDRRSVEWVREHHDFRRDLDFEAPE